MRFSVITLPICLIGAISANPHPTGGSVSGSESDSCGNGLDCESNGMYSNSDEKAKVPKGDSFNYKEPTRTHLNRPTLKEGWTFYRIPAPT
ncbi:hypothetical protein BASA50_000204 [Batrachochytrium salamandrivorans]|uniref:Uncharacterized protein n=1 Tax=Batrachochytrium salamandrivorans TaxID=1357716 RepID=A0ABQ8EV19_9FUNG|nr:hypothetical protein BASA50_000204 [Batrachochytrium salamandrivorans]